MTDLFVQYSSICIHSYRSPEQYGDWSASYDFRVTGVSLTSSDTYMEEKLGCLVDVAPGDPVFVLSMTYSSGDSFGNSDGNGEILWVFKDSKLALQAKQLWQKENEKDNPEYSIEFEVDGGKKVKLSNPAAGYFENLGHVSIDTFLVNP